MSSQGKPYDYVGQIDFGVGMEKCRFPLKGKGIESINSIRPSFLQFGDVAVSDHREQTVDISNTKSSLPVRFSIPKIPPAYKCQPSSGLIPPGQSVLMTVGYYPKVEINPVLLPLTLHASY